MPSRLSLSALLLLLTLAPPALAGVITGRVVDFNGVGVANVNIEADFSSGGGNPTVLNGGTDLNGYFTTTITPNGVFDLLFTPPAPPVTTHLCVALDAVSVVNTVDLGTLVLPRGYALSGRVVNPAGLAVAGVNLDVLDAAGNDLGVPNDFTDLLGNFVVAVPAGSLTVRLDTSGVLGETLAPKEFGATVAGHSNLGTVPLAAGFFLSGTVKRSNLTPVVDVDLDVVDAATGLQLFTPSDNTNSTGNFAVVVPAGIYDVRFCPPFQLLLVAGERTGLVVGANLSLGTVTLQGGVVLSGTVQAFNGLKYAGVDVDVRVAGGGAPVVLCNDNTTALGAYQVIVPTGTFDVRFTPPYALPLASQFANGVVVAANKIVNGTLPSCPFYSTVGAGTPGTGGATPQISATGGAPRLGNPDYALSVSNGRGGATAVLAWSPSPRIAGPFGPPGSSTVLTANGGYRVVTLSGALGAAGAGSATVPLPIGSQAVLSGLTLRARAYVLDRAGANGKAFTPTLEATLQL